MDSESKMCIVCFKNNNTKVPLFSLWDSGEDKIAYVIKLQAFSDIKLIHTEYTLLCADCINELNNSYGFKIKVASSQSFWQSTCVQPDAIIPLENNHLEAYEAVVPMVIHPTEYKDEGVQQQNGSYELNKTISNENLNDKNNEHHFQSYYNFSQDNLIDNIAKDMSELNSHAAPESIEYPNEFQCSSCLLKFLNSAELQEHNCTLLEPKLNVPDVDSQNKIKKVKNSKESKAKDVKDDEKWCKFCGYEADKQWKLQKHISHVHRDKTFMCEYCPKAFKHSYHLQEHLLIHTGEKKFPCNFCGKNFQRKSSQRRHIQTHDAKPGEKVKNKPYLCTICGKKFPYSNGAQRHMRTHTGERKFKCNICEKQFKQSTHLHVHLRTHTGEKPYMCNICGDSFSLKPLLQRHFNVHKEENKNNVEIKQNLEPNLSETVGNNDLASFSAVEMINNQLYIVTN